MGFLTALLVGGLVLGGAGLYQQHEASKDMKEAQMAEIAQQREIEAQRKKQMDLEYRRQQTQILRNAQKARSLSLATATAQNAAQGSALPGAYGGISGQMNTQLLAGNQNYEIGNNIFGLNAGISNSRMQYASAASDYSTGAGLTSLGGMLLTNAGTINNNFKSAASSFGRGFLPPTGWNSPFRA